MKVLFDIVHPAQVHFFKNLIARLRDEGHRVLVASRDKDVALPLLDALGIEHRPISRRRNGLPALATELLVRDLRFLRLVRRFKPDVLVARVGISAALAGWLTRTPRVIFDDMEHARLQAAISLPFATYICTGLGYYRDFGKRHVRFGGSPVMAYMAPRYFRPDPKIPLAAGLDPEAPYIFIRRVSWQASHDVGRKGEGAVQLRDIVRRLESRGRIVVSSEEPLPEDLLPYQNPVPVEHIHHLLAFASLCLVEGGTMAAEAAVLGVPTVCLGTYDFGYLRALEKDYGLILRPATRETALDAAAELLQRPGLKDEWRRKRDRLLAESDDVTDFMAGMVRRAAREHPVRRRDE